MAVEDWRRVLLPLVVGNSHGVHTARKLSQYHFPSALQRRAADEIAALSCRDSRRGQDGIAGDRKSSTEEEEEVESLDQMAARLLREMEKGTFPPTMVVRTTQS